MTDTIPTPEFSRPVAIDKIDRRGIVRTIEADAAEREALARRFGLVSIERLTATVRLRSVNGGTAIRLDAHVDARVTQPCVVTLEPVPGTVSSDFVLLYTKEAGGDEIELAFEDETVEPLVGSEIDVGEAVAQELPIALDPYPRAPDATVESLDADAAALQEPPEEKQRPFSGLAHARALGPGHED